jgi:hypothetical protein
LPLPAQLFGRKSEVREVLSRVKAIADVSLDTPAMAARESRSRYRWTGKPGPASAAGPASAGSPGR